jgi:hypothetical protein
LGKEGREYSLTSNGIQGTYSSRKVMGLLGPCFGLRFFRRQRVTDDGNLLYGKRKSDPLRALEYFET